MIQRTRFRLTRIVLPLLLITILISCKKERTQIPYVPVNIQININNPAYIDLNAVSGWTYITGGSKGIVIYRSSLDQFVTFERHCPHLPENNCVVSVDSTNIMLQDPCSTSRFLLTDGSVIEGPATLGLLRYENTFDGTFLNIYN